MTHNNESSFVERMIREFEKDGKLWDELKYLLNQEDSELNDTLNRILNINRNR